MRSSHYYFKKEYPTYSNLSSMAIGPPPLPPNQNHYTERLLPCESVTLFPVIHSIWVHSIKIQKLRKCNIIVYYCPFSPYYMYLVRSHLVYSTHKHKLNWLSRKVIAKSWFLNFLLYPKKKTSNRCTISLSYCCHLCLPNLNYILDLSTSDVHFGRIYFRSIFFYNEEKKTKTLPKSSLYILITIILCLFAKYRCTYFSNPKQTTRSIDVKLR